MNGENEKHAYVDKVYKLLKRLVSREKKNATILRMIRCCRQNCNNDL